MEAVVAQTWGRFGALHGVIHAGGVTAGGLVSTSSEKRVDSRLIFKFLLKVHGLYVLEQALKGKPLYFCIPISSNAGILGGLGLCAYSAAERFMGCVCHQSQQEPLTLDKHELGRLAHRGSHRTRFQLSHKYRSICDDAQESNSAFERILSGATGQVVISSRDVTQTRPLDKT